MNVPRYANTRVAVSNNIADYEEVIPYSVLPSNKTKDNNVTLLSHPYLYTQDEVISLNEYICIAPESTITPDDEIVLHTKIPNNIAMLQNTQKDWKILNNEDDSDDDEIVLHTQIPSGSNMIVNREICLEISNSNVLNANNVSNNNVLEVDGVRNIGIQSDENIGINLQISKDVIEVEVKYDEETNDEAIDRFIARRKVIDSQNLENNSKVLNSDDFISSDEDIEDKELQNCRNISGIEAIPNFEESLRTKKENLIKKLREATEALSNIQPQSYRVNSNKTLRKKIHDRIGRERKGHSNKSKVNNAVTCMRQCKLRKNIWAGLDTPLRVPKHTSSEQNASQMTFSQHSPEPNIFETKKTQI